ncbi:MAG: NADH-quinone oxidoreductase subunit NuoN [Alphaproteobacteria bacterium]|nr:NADH-quinone oxidoreductase subunit NuoN [Alphaproteobacteria bacterium]
MTDIMNGFSYAIPEVMLAVGAMALLIAGVFFGDKSAKPISLAAVLLLAAALLAALFIEPKQGASLFGGAFRADAFATFAKIIIYAAGAFAILMSDRYLAGEKLGRFEYPVLIVLATFGMSLMASANDLISLYMGIETHSLALYILAAFNRDSRRSTEAGLKYFVLGALSSGMLLYGASLIYGFAGSTSFQEIARVASASGADAGLIVGLVFLISGLAFKVSAAPFHMWAPDVYEGAPTPVTAFFASAPKIAGMALFVRALVAPFPDIIDQWRPVIAAIAIASMLIGAFSAIAQTNIKRLMAYSSIGHMGYALIGLAAGTKEGVSAVLIYMAIYVVMTIGTFACILLMRRRGGLTENISDLAGLSRTNGPMGLVVTILFFSLAGVPVTAGFFGKWFVFVAAVNAHMVWLAVVGAVISVISAYYYLRVVWIMWFNDPAPAFERGTAPALGFTAALCAVLIFPILVMPPFIGALIVAAQNAAAALF